MLAEHSSSDGLAVQHLLVVIITAYSIDLNAHSFLSLISRNGMHLSVTFGMEALMVEFLLPRL